VSYAVGAGITTAFGRRGADRQRPDRQRWSVAVVVRLEWAFDWYADV